ncbi:MAG: glycosyltransferase [Acidobacteriaceae bacterium]|nr:glycosyltransferase [Acidobacteriaceae bacterium]
MRVLHVIPSVGPLRGGPSSVIRSLACGLSEQGIEVHICTTDDNGPERSDVPLGRPRIENGATVFYFPRQFRLYTVSLPLARWLMRNVHHYDLVHIHAVFSFASTIAAFCARARRVPYLIRPLGVLNAWGLRNRRAALKQLSLRLVEKLMFASAACVHFTSEQERQEALKAGVSAPSVVIPNPFSPLPTALSKGEFRNAHPAINNRRIILFLSRLDRKKGLELLLEAFACLRRGEACLVIAGDGEHAYKQHLRATAERLGLADEICWTGFLNGSAKAAALADADVFVLPSYSENFGNAVVEALIAGVPVIISDQVAIHAELSSCEAALVVPCEAAAISSALGHLLSSPELAGRLRDRGPAAARELFSLESVAGKLLESYRKILRSSSGEEAAQIKSGATPARTA